MITGSWGRCRIEGRRILTASKFLLLLVVLDDGVDE